MSLRRRSNRRLAVVASLVLLVFALVQGGCREPMAKAAAPTWATPVLPDTPAGRQVEAYLGVLNSDDPEVLKAFVAQQFTPEGPGGSDIASRTRSQLRLQKSSRGLNLYDIPESRNDAVTIIAQFRLTQEWRRMTFTVEPAPPHRISGVMIVPVDAPAIADEAAMSDDELAEEVDTYVKRLVAADQFSGAVLLARDGEPLFVYAHGLANREADVPNRPATRFSYASVGKMFTAIAIAQLVDAGVLDYQRPVLDYLPEYGADAAGAITIDQLLTHRSGLADYFEESGRFEAVRTSANPARTFTELIMRESLRFTPGDRVEYSNTNYELLGLIIERLSGMRYADYLQSRIFEPADMTETSLSPDGIEVDLLARGYTQLSDDGQIGEGPRRRFGDGPGSGGAAGGGYTTVGDLLKFDCALRDHRLLSPAATDAVLTARVDEGRPGYRYGYGFIIRSSGEDRIVGHSGGFPGVDAQFEMYLDRGYTVVVLANYELIAEPVVKHIEQLLRFK